MRVAGAALLFAAIVGVESLFACGASPRTSGASDATVSVTSGVASTPPPAANTPFTRGAPYVFFPRAENAKLTSFIPGGDYLRLASDGRTAVVSTSHSARLYTSQLPSGISLPGTHAYRTAFSPHVQRFATSDETTGDVNIFALPSGKLERKIAHAFSCFPCAGPNPGTIDDWQYEIAFSDETTLYLHDGYGLRRIDLSTPASQPVDVGPKITGLPLVRESGDLWIVETRLPPPVRRVQQVIVIDGKTGASRVALDHTAVGIMTDVTPSPAGDRVCFQHQRPDALECATLADGHVDFVEAGNLFGNWFVFSPDGKKLLFEDPRANSYAAESTIELADLEARTVRVATTLPRSVGTLVTFGFASPTRFFAIGNGFTPGDGAMVGDLAAGWSMDLSSLKIAQLGAYAVPGRPQRLALMRAPAGPTQLYWADFPE